MVTHMGIQPWKLGPWLAGVVNRNRQGGLTAIPGALTVQPMHIFTDQSENHTSGSIRDRNQKDFA